jgi:hypothetical protein
MLSHQSDRWRSTPRIWLAGGRPPRPAHVRAHADPLRDIRPTLFTLQHRSLLARRVALGAAQAKTTRAGRPCRRRKPASPRILPPAAACTHHSAAAFRSRAEGAKSSTAETRAPANASSTLSAKHTLASAVTRTDSNLAIFSLPLRLRIAVADWSDTTTPQ